MQLKAGLTRIASAIPRPETPVASPEIELEEEISRPVTQVSSQPEESMDEPRDEDYQPMDVDHDAAQQVYASRTQELIRPVQLHSLQIGIDPYHHCIVCEGCQCGVPRASLHNHITQSHGGASLIPYNLESILDQHDVPYQICPPAYKVIPVASIPIIPGFMCSVPNCGVTYVEKASLARHHSQIMHQDIPPHERIQSTLVQVIFPARNEHQVWPIDPNYTILNQNLEYASALDKMKQHDAQGWDDGRIHTPRDPRHVNGFLKEFGWLRITEGKDYKGLCSLVETPSEDCPALLPLKDKLEGYFGRIKPMVEGMAPLVLRWINTPEGYFTSI